MPFERFPDWFPILGGRFHDHFLDLLLEQPCSQRSKLFWVATKHPPLKLVLTVDLNVRHNYGQHLFMNIDSRYPVSHNVPLARSGERAAVTLSRVAGYRRSLRVRQRRPIIRSITHAPDQTGSGPFDLTLSDFHEVSRA
jgi:hypothetical protein